MAHNDRPKTRLPAIDSFAFDTILRDIESEIRDDIDSIAAICAKSRLSRATEHAAHRPPQGEIRATTALEAVLEVSSDDGHSPNLPSTVEQLNVKSPTVAVNASQGLTSRGSKSRPVLALLANHNEVERHATHDNELSAQVARTSSSICAADINNLMIHSHRPASLGRTQMGVIARLKSQLEHV